MWDGVFDVDCFRALIEWRCECVKAGFAVGCSGNCLFPKRSLGVIAFMVDSQRGKSISRKLLATWLSVFAAASLLLVTACPVFGVLGGSDSSDPKILGVGRIKSKPTSEPISPNKKLVLGNGADSAKMVSIVGLAVPVDKPINNGHAAVPSEPAAPAATTASAEQRSADPSANQPIAQPVDSSPAGNAAAANPPATHPADPAPNPAPKPSTESQATGGSWSSGLASAYGEGFYGDKTARGHVLTKSSMGVAVPVSKSYLLGKTIEISYGGKTIRAVANDTGGFGSLGRDLDLQPGIWKSFGFSDEDQWGVRMVKWRVVK